MARSSKSFKPAPSPKPGGGLSRRGFLKGAGVTAVSTALLDGGLAKVAEAQAKAAEPKVLGPGPVPITLNINGQDKQVKAEPRTTLAEALRTHLDMTGTKVVCDRGACSACTVWLDGTPVNSCMTLAIDVGNRKITTIEGLAPSLEQLHPVQEAFIEHDGMQCGFCTSGMIMSCAALLNRNPHPSLKDVKDAVAGNLCRCGTYPHVFKATLAAAERTGGAAKA
jgi:aerobic-type carbon monoxide dehydrogenase small subunit (CoxS/CutS family)